MNGRDQFPNHKHLLLFHTPRSSRGDMRPTGVPHLSETTSEGEVIYPSKAPGVAADIYSPRQQNLI